ncbi:MAG: Asp23/Gls24 family envelope stress response protein, partial [Oscillospiraceae bacterium]
VESISNPNVTFKQLFFKSSKNDSIKIKPVGDVVEVSISVIAKQGHKVTTLAEAIQERVKTDVQSMTGVTVSRVNVSVAGISFEANN